MSEVTAKRRKKWMYVGLGGLFVVVAGAVTAVATYPSWAAGWVEEELVERLSKRLGGEVGIGALELDYDRVVLRDVTIELDDTHMMFAKVDISVDRDALWSRQVRVVDVGVEGGEVVGEVDSLREVARKVVSRRDDGNQAKGRISLTPQKLTVSDLAVNIAREGTGSLMGVLDVEVVPADKQIAVALKKAVIAREGGRGLKASQIETSLAWTRTDAGIEPTFPLTVKVRGGATSITEKIAVAGTNGSISIADAKISTIGIDLRGGFSDRDGDGDSELAELWSLQGDVQRDLSVGQITLEMKAFELGRVPQVLANLPVVKSESATVGGQVAVDFAEGKAAVEGDVALAGLNVNHPLLARHVVPGIGFNLDFKGSIDPQARTVEVEHATITRGDVALKLDGVFVHPPTREQRKYKIHALVPQVNCQDVLDALPHELVPSLVGMKVGGKFGLDITADIDFSNLEEATLSGKVDYLGCKVKSVPELLSEARLRGTFSHRPVMRDGSIRKIDLFPGSGTYSPYEQISKYMTDAVRTTEDGGFWRHKGFLPSQFEKALRRNLAAGRIRLGASTISMQMVKNVLLSHERTLSRKLQEMVLTWYVEQVLDKKRIIELYLNVIEFGPGIYGVTRASRHYFGKHPLEINPAEAAYLALMLPSPVRRHVHWCEGSLSPRFDKKLRNILRLMHERGRIDAAIYEQWKDFQIVFDHSERDSPDACKAQIKRLMEATSTQHAMSGMLSGGSDVPTPVGEHPVLDDPALDFSDDPADGEVDKRPAMDGEDEER